jgi:predicted alpha/beta hydrolase family esterase
LNATEKLHPDVMDFREMPRDALPFPTLVVGSLNDPYMPLDQLINCGRLWNSDIRNLGLAGHINIASGYGRWAGGYALLEGLKARTEGRVRKFHAA